MGRSSKHRRGGDAWTGANDAGADTTWRMCGRAGAAVVSARTSTRDWTGVESLRDVSWSPQQHSTIFAVCPHSCCLATHTGCTACANTGPPSATNMLESTATADTFVRRNDTAITGTAGCVPSRTQKCGRYSRYSSGPRRTVGSFSAGVRDSPHLLIGRDARVLRAPRPGCYLAYCCGF